MVDTGNHLRITLVGALLGQEFQSVWNYRVNASLASPTSAALVAEAYWNTIDDVWRAMYPATSVWTTTQVRCADNADPEGEFGVFAIPTNQQQGTRTITVGEEIEPSFMAVGVRLTVGTRLTRPGQKRIPWVMEKDVSGNTLSSSLVSLVGAFMGQAEGALVLTAPALTMELQSEVYGAPTLDPVRPARYQDTTGYLINPLVTTQNSRKARI